MRVLLTSILLFISLSVFSQKYGRIVSNPLTGKMEYVYNPYAQGDSIVNLGYHNWPTSSYSGTLSTIIGYGNSMGSNDGIAIGWDNVAACYRVYTMGKNIRCDSDQGMPIGMSTTKVKHHMPGSVAFCPTADWAVMHVHSGFPQASNSYESDIGGVRIGKGMAYNGDSTALEIIAHGDRLSAPSTAQLIATENNEWTIDPDEMILTGSISTGYLECDYTPKVHSAASDTSVMHTPLKIGDYFIDTSARDVYISTGTTRGDWVKVN